MSVSDQIKQQVAQEFFCEKEIILLKTAKLESIVIYRVGEAANISHILSRGSVTHCFKLLHNVQYRTTERTAPNR